MTPSREKFQLRLGLRMRNGREKRKRKREMSEARDAMKKFFWSSARALKI